MSDRWRPYDPEVGAPPQPRHSSPLSADDLPPRRNGILLDLWEALSTMGQPAAAPAPRPSSFRAQPFDA